MPLPVVMLMLGSPVSPAHSQGDAAVPPWQRNRPIVSVRKELCREHPRPGAAAVVGVSYVGPGLERREVQAVEFRDNVHSERSERWSLDNGRTWSAAQPLPSTDVYYEGQELWEGGGADLYDPVVQVLVGVWLRQIAVDGLYHNSTYYRLSRDLGRTWSQPKQLRYEPGVDFDPAHPHSSEFLGSNEAYLGSNLLRHSNGTLIHCVAHANAPHDPANAQRVWKMGSLCFIGRWVPAAGDYEWEAGGRVEVSPELSARGLMEPEAAELQDGRVLVVWRTSTHGWDGTVAKTPGRKLFSLSTNGGRALSAPQEWRYADGTSFYSPSSFHRMIRHSVTGKLYWIGNICAEPPVGNSPRYPLVIAEVDEVEAALRQETVTVIDDRRPDQPAEIQFSNFSLLEDRETHALELYLTAYGEDLESTFSANCYRYTLAME